MDNVCGVKEIFGDNSEILFFIIIFLLLFCDNRSSRRVCC